MSSAKKLELLERARATIGEAERLRSDSEIAQFEQLIEKYRQALADLKVVGRRHDQAKVLKELGDLFYLADKQKLSLEYYEEALRLLRSTDDRTMEVELLAALADAHAFLGQNQVAVRLYLQARQLSRQVAYESGEARAMAGLGEAYYNLSDARATEHLEKALAMWRALGNDRRSGRALMYLGYIQTDLSKLPQALDYYNQALILFRSARDQRGEALTINAIALLHTLQGERDLGVEHYDKAEQLFRKTRDGHGLATALNGKGNLYLELDLKLALDCHSEALAVSHETGNLEDQVISHLYLGYTHRALGHSISTSDGDRNSHYDTAIQHFDKSLQLSRRLGDHRIEAYCMQDIAGVYDSKQDTQKALYNYERSLILSRRVKDLRGQVLILNRISEIQVRSGNRQKAFTRLQLALRLARAAEDRAGESMTLYNLARIKQTEGDLAAAMTSVDRALTIVESLRSKVPGYNFRSSYSESVYRYYQLKIDLLMAQHKRNPGAGLDMKAWEQTEIARARSLVDMLSDARAKIRTDVSPALLDEERDLQQLLNTKADQQFTLLSGAHTKEQAAAAEKEIRELSSKYENVQAQIRRQSPHYAALMEPQSLSVTEIQQKILDDDSILLEYLLGDERSYLWVLSRTEVSSHELPGRAEIEHAARTVYSLLTASQPAPGESFEERETRVARANQQLPSQIANLSNLLLEPVFSKLKTKRLLIVADGALQYIPFQVLTVPVSGQQNASENSFTVAGRRPLVADHEILNEPSASALMLLVGETIHRKRASGSVAVLADPVFEIDDPRLISRDTASVKQTPKENAELNRAVRDVGISSNGARIPRLPASRDEADAIMSVAPWRSGLKATGFDANRATAMRSDLSNYRVVHFATHGLLNNEHPELSGIVLSLVDKQGHPQDGFLRLHDIYNLKLSVDLVVLSACNTGLGKDVRGEGLVGLTRGFMYAGASSVVASLWKVDDEATAELMRHFYKFMLQDNLSPAAALRKAQLEMQKQKRWQSPYYWSGFIMQGQYLQPEPVSSLKWDPVARLVVLSAAVLAVLLLFRLRRKNVF